MNSGRQEMAVGWWVYFVFVSGRQGVQYPDCRFCFGDFKTIVAHSRFLHLKKFHWFDLRSGGCQYFAAAFQRCLDGSEQRNLRSLYRHLLHIM